MYIEEQIKNLIDDHSQYGLYQAIESYLQHLRMHLLSLSTQEAKRQTLSGLNWLSRKDLRSSMDNALRLNIGDICFIDFGKAYINEAGYQHFGLIVAMANYKAFVIPMSSNPKTIEKSPNVINETRSRKHLYYLGMLEGMNRPSVLFLNDAKFINSSRVIDVIAHLDPNSSLFKEIINQLLVNVLCFR